MSRTLFLALAILALACSVSAHAGHNSRGGMPYGWRNARAVTASTCSAYQCAVTDGNCDGVTIFCPTGQHCGVGGKCAVNVALGQSCNSNSIEDECDQGSCVNSQCSYLAQLMPGTPCNVSSECWNDGTGAGLGSCVSNKCSGKQNGEACSSSSQCVSGNWCNSGVCQTLSQENQGCSSASDVTGCDSKFTCLNNICSKRYSVAAGGACAKTENCQSGLYCSASKVCTKVSAKPSSKASCDISTSACQADEECSCSSYASGTSTTATCNAIRGTYANMASIESDSNTCLINNGCAEDDAVCIRAHCLKEFCTYFSRSVNSIFDLYPSCMPARMVNGNSFAGLVDSCRAYAPDNKEPTATSSGSVVSASLFALVAFVAFFAL